MTRAMLLLLAIAGCASTRGAEGSSEPGAKRIYNAGEARFAAGEPEQAVPKIVEGRMGAWYAERVLPEQGMFGEKQTVDDRLGDASVVRFAQAIIGES